MKARSNINQKLSSAKSSTEKALSRTLSHLFEAIVTLRPFQPCVSTLMLAGRSCSSRWFNWSLISLLPKARHATVNASSKVVIDPFIANELIHRN
jgi:hypothetical protein